MSEARDDAPFAAEVASAAETPPLNEDGAPLLRVVKGEPTPEQLAALVAVVAARRPAADVVEATATPARRTGWAARERTLRGVHRLGPGQWRARNPR